MFLFCLNSFSLRFLQKQTKTFFSRKITGFSNNTSKNPGETCTYRVIIANQRYSNQVQTLHTNKNCLKNGIWVQHSRFCCLGNPKELLFLSAFSSKNYNWSTYSIFWSQEIKLGKNANHCTIISSCGNYINKDFQKQLKKYRGNFTKSYVKILSTSDSFQNPGYEIFYICKSNWFIKKYSIS